MVEVAVIGAGAAGLVATRHLLRSGIRACLFESRLFPGGAWSAATKAAAGAGGCSPYSPCSPYDSYADPPPPSPQMWENLTPNLSKYTCCFSDFPWPEGTPAFPTLANMNTYLDDYAAKYVLHNNNDDDCNNEKAAASCTLHFGCTVTRVSSSSSERECCGRCYHVEWADQDGVSQSKQFDGVVVATGFFSTPVCPPGLLPLLRDDDDDNDSHDDATTTLSTKPTTTTIARAAQVLHSSQYRSFDSSCSGSSSSNNETAVAVIGGSFSAHEIAADVRRHCQRVVNIIGGDHSNAQSPVPYVLPRYVPTTATTTAIADGGGSAFLPIDCVLYQRLGPADVAPKTPETIVMDEHACRGRHQMLQALIGSRKQAQAAAMGFPTFAFPSSLEKLPPAAVSISDDYLNLVIDGKIEVVTGRLKRATLASSSERPDEADVGRLNLELEDGTIVTGIDKIISCTGYKSRLDFLAPEILATLQYDESDPFAPLVACYDAVHPQLPGLGFVGMYKGAYFGVMELQARLIAGLLGGQIGPLSQETIARALDASQSIREREPRAQFPHFDYIGLMDSLAEQLDLVPKGEFGAQGMMVSPAFYQDDDEIARQCRDALKEEFRRQCDNIPRAAMSALVGKWTFERSITDSLTSSTQRVYGEIRYSLQEPHFDSLRYREDGFLDLPNGNRLEVFREYEYLHQHGMLEIYFVENGERANLFLSLKFDKQDNGYWMATSDHLCIKDLYKGTFKIAFDGLGASEVSMAYRVKGPNKDYESVTHLRPIL